MKFMEHPRFIGVARLTDGDYCAEFAGDGAALLEDVRGTDGFIYSVTSNRHPLSGPAKRVRMIIAPTLPELAARCNEWLRAVVAERWHVRPPRQGIDL